MAAASKQPQPVSRAPLPVQFYDHLPGILAFLPMVGFGVCALLMVPHQLGWGWKILGQDTIFWVGVVVAIFWYVAFRFNMPKRRFWFVFGLMGTFLGIPVVLELVGYWDAFSWMGGKLGQLAPSANVGAYVVVAGMFGIVWIANLIWSRLHLSVRMDESGLTIRRAGGKSERFELIGLKTEHEPLDYAETAIGGFGTLALKTRTNLPIFRTNRVFGLYWCPLMPWRKPMIQRIEELLSFQGKVSTVSAAEKLDQLEAEESVSHEEAAAADEADGLSEDHAEQFDEYEAESPDAEGDSEIK